MDVITSLAVGLACQFTSAALDGRAPFASRYAMTFEGGPTTAVVRSDDDPDRRFRVDQRGIWTTFTGLDPNVLGRTTVVDIGEDGWASLVIRQTSGAPKIIAREGNCQPLAPKDQ